MAEPDENSFVITAVLRGVKKSQALEFAAQLEIAAIRAGIYPPEVFTAHLKDYTCPDL
jgi:hypothetical protein